MRTFKILVIGEALVDQFGDVQVLGGAPFNLARHLAGLGPALSPSCSVDVTFISRVGEDELGQQIAQDAASLGLDPSAIQRDAVHATGVVHVSLNNGSPSYRIAQPAAWDFIEAPRISANWDLICFSSLALRSEVSQRAVLQTLDAHPKASRFFDLNLRATGPADDVIQALLSRTNWLKASDEELAVLAPRLDLPSDLDSAMGALHRRHGIQQSVLTRGAEGASAFGADGEALAHAPGQPNDAVSDTVGAGDSFSAAWLLCKIAGIRAEQALKFANRYAAAVCGIPGPMPAIADRPAFFAPQRAALAALCLEPQIQTGAPA